MKNGDKYFLFLSSLNRSHILFGRLDACFYVICISGYDFNFNFSFTDNTMHVSMWQIPLPADAMVRINRPMRHSMTVCTNAVRSSTGDETNVNINHSLVLDYFSLCYFGRRAHMCVHLVRVRSLIHSFIHARRLVSLDIFLSFFLLFSAFFSSSFLFIFHQRLEKSFSTMWLTSVRTSRTR